MRVRRALRIDHGVYHRHRRAVTERHPALIDESRALEACFDALGGAAHVAIAVEDSGTRAYRPEVCLVEIAVVPARDGSGAAPELFALDPTPFRGVRPHPFEALLDRIGPNTTVLIHGGDYAVAGLRRDFHLRFARDEGPKASAETATPGGPVGTAPPTLVDTQQAAVLLGLPETGYKSLCRALLGIELGAPVSQNWRERPLPYEAVAGALLGVTHVPRLWAVLAERIAAKELGEELAIASRIVARTSERANQPDPGRFRYIEGAAALVGLQRALLAAIVQWRDAKARAFDCPPGRVLPNPQLVALCRAGEQAADEVSMGGFHSRLLWNDREELRRLIARVLADPRAALEAASTAVREPLAQPRKGAPIALVRARTRALKLWRRDEAARREVGLQAVLPGAALEHLAFFGAGELAAVPQLGAARIARYGVALVRLCEAGG
jgi:ribonuclease D